MKKRIIEAIEETFGGLTVSRGGNCKFLGIEIEFLINRRVFIFMKDRIEESIASFRKALGEKLSFPAKNGLQNINKN